MLTNLAGDLLRAEQQRPGSTYGAMIKEYITEGKIVPMEVTVKVSHEAHLDYEQLTDDSCSRTQCEIHSRALPPFQPTLLWPQTGKAEGDGS